MDWVDRSQNYKRFLAGIFATFSRLPFGQFFRQSLKIRLVAFHSLTFQLQRLYFQSN